MAYSRIDMFDHRENIQYILLKKRCSILVLEIIFAQ